MELDDRCEELIRTLPLQTGRTMLAIAFVGAVFFLFGIVTLNQLPPNPDGWTVGFGVTSAVLGGTTLVFIGILYLDRRFRRNSFREMLSGEALAHWTYTDDEWNSYCRHQQQQMQQNFPFTGDNLLACLFLGGIFAGLTWIISWNWDEYRWSAIGIAFALGAAFGLVAGLFEWIGWHFWCRGLKKRKGETFITPNSVYFHSRLHAWSHFGGRLKSLTHETPKRLPISLLIFEVAVVAKRGEHIHTLAVPVPAAQRETAEQIVGKL